MQRVQGGKPLDASQAPANLQVCTCVCVPDPSGIVCICGAATSAFGCMCLPFGCMCLPFQHAQFLLPVWSHSLQLYPEAWTNVQGWFFMVLSMLLVVRQ